jgi:hypothetical protein
MRASGGDFRDRHRECDFWNAGQSAPNALWVVADIAIEQKFPTGTEANAKFRSYLNEAFPGPLRPRFMQAGAEITK